MKLSPVIIFEVTSHEDELIKELVECGYLTGWACGKNNDLLLQLPKNVVWKPGEEFANEKGFAREIMDIAENQFKLKMD